MQAAETALVQAEADYAEHRIQLKAFEQAYGGRSGRQRELAKWEGLIAQQLERAQFLRSVQDGIEACPRSPYARFPTDEPTAQPSGEDVTPDEPFLSQEETSVEIKSLYRDLARRYHPDLAENAETRRQRAVVMQEINQAYQIGDLKTLVQISNRPAIVDPEKETLGDRLVWIIRRETKSVNGFRRQINLRLKPAPWVS